MRAVRILLIFLIFGAANATEIAAVRTWQAPDQTRLVFDLSSPAAFDVFTVDAPDRLVIDLTKTSIKAPLALSPDGRIRSFRQARRGADGLRLVLELEHPMDVRKALLPPAPPYGDRLVIDLVDKPGKVRRPAAGPVGGMRAVDDEAPRPGVFTVVLDPGHGGDDTGAIGGGGTHEKQVVLAVARALKSRIDQTPGMRAVLTRDGDYYLGLRERMARARAAHADLFVSVHADAFRDPRVRGSSVFVLSRRGATSEAARWLAERENASDLIGGLTLGNKDAQLRSVLLDLSQTASLKSSLKVADNVLGELRGLGPLHFREVQQAGFMVLKSPDVPSLLVETAYITNPEEERRLNDSAFQLQLADAIHRGIEAYRRAMATPALRLAKGSKSRPGVSSVREMAAQ